MKRDLEKLQTENFDILIIGGGIHGAAIAQLTAQAGLKTALIEQRDFCQATSANSLKIIHGGLRYLQHLNIKRMRESIRSRRLMALIAPQQIQPLPCVIPTNGLGLKSKPAMATALLLNDFVSWDRNKYVNADTILPRGKVVSKKKFLEFYPQFTHETLTGGALWYDYLALDTERLVLRFIQNSAQHGAIPVNYVKATKYILSDNQVKGVIAEDTLSGETFNINAKVVVNTVGPWLNLMNEKLSFASKEPVHWAKAVNIVVKKKLVSQCAIGLSGSRSFVDNDAIIQKGERLFFFVPWMKYTMIGTTYKPYQGAPENCTIEKEDIIEMLDEANSIFPNADLTFDDVSFFHCGLLPMSSEYSEENSDVQLEKHSQIINHEKSNRIKGLFSIKGVKFTTAPVVAERFMKIIAPYFGLSKSISFDNIGLEKINDPNLQIYGKENYSHLINRYGKNADLIFKIISNDKELSKFISQKPDLIRAEIVYCIHNEMALKLSDIIFRRTSIGSAECPDYEIISQIANIMAQELHWDEQKKQLEIEEVFQAYHPLDVSKKYIKEMS